MERASEELLPGEDPLTDDHDAAEMLLDLYDHLLNFSINAMTRRGYSGSDDERHLAPLARRRSLYLRRRSYWRRHLSAIVGPRLDGHTGKLWCDGVAITLTPRERDLVRVLLAHSGVHLPAVRLVAEAWDESLSEAQLRIYVGRLREKLKVFNSVCIDSQPRRGYTLKLIRAR